MPRAYRLGHRATLVDATRARILDAALDLYARVGISATTMREIGVRADVAPGTLRNHFPTRDDLDRAMVERLTSGIALPDRSIFDGAVTLEDRLRRVIHAAATFLDQAAPLYRLWLREPMLTAPWTEKGAEYGARWDELVREALGPLAGDEEAMAVLRASMYPAYVEGVRAGRRSTDEGAELIASLVVPWCVARAGAARPSGSGEG